MNELEIGSGGLSTGHSPDHVCSRPHGIPEYLLMCFSSAYYVKTQRGEFIGGPGDVLLIPPDTPHEHGTPAGSKTGFVNDWIHFKGPRVEAWLRRYPVPVDQPIATGRSDFLREPLRQIMGELELRRAHWREAAGLALEGALIALSRQGERPRPGAHDGALVRLREKIRLQPERVEGVPAMAQALGLSVSRFSVLYRAAFGRSPAEDLIQLRLAKAKEQLRCTDRTVALIAEACGFANAFYFSRIFRQRVGMTPSDFRREGPRAA